MSFLSRSWSYPDWSATEWNRIRRGIALIWLGWVLWIVWSYHSQPVPTGLSRVVNLSFLTAPGINVLITLLSLAAAIQYWRGRQLLLASSVMALLGILTFTLHDSQGAFQRNEVLNLVLLGQVIFGIQAWLKARKGEAFSSEVMRNRLIFNSQQMLLATYLISGITKLSTSGLGWVTDSPNISVQIYKAQMAMYNSLEWGFFKDLATLFSDLSADYPWLVQLTFAGALCLELFCFLALLNRRISKVVGSLLLTMHIGIFVLFGVFFIPFFVLVILLLIGPGKGRKRVAHS